MDQNLNTDIASLSKDLSPQTAPGVWESVFKQLPISSGKILNAGAGRGGLTKLLSKRGFDVVSLDLHPEHFNLPEMTCSYADFNESINLESEQFDAVIAVEVIEHLESPWKFMREALRLTRAGGSLIVTTPNVISLPARLSFLRTAQLPYFRYESFVGCYHVTPIFPWSVERWAETTGSKIEKIIYSRSNWPDKRDIPRSWERRWITMMKQMLPVNMWFGEISCFHIIKNSSRKILVNPGVHYG